MANGADYGAGSQTLIKAAGDVRDAKTRFDTESKRLANELDNMKKMWVGEGGAAFTKLHTMWVEKQNKINMVLDQFADSLDTTDKTNKANDADQNAAISKIAAILDA